MQNDHYSFIVRIWRETEDREPEQATWRGSIDDVDSHKRLYFNDLDGVTRFIEEQVGHMANRSKVGWTARLVVRGETIISQIQKWTAPRRSWNRHDKR